MNWQAHKPVKFNGKVYGQKDVEFTQFASLPKLVESPCEISVSGKNIPITDIESNGWRVRDAHEVTPSYDSYVNYIYNSKGEFSVCKNIFVETNSGWFSDRSAVYLASGRPVVMQDTGFSAHLPCGSGLFAVNNVDEAAEAIIEINSDVKRHSKRAREIALEYLDARKVIGKFLNKLGL